MIFLCTCVIQSSLTAMSATLMVDPPYEQTTELKVLFILSEDTSTSTDVYFLDEHNDKISSPYYSHIVYTSYILMGYQNVYIPVNSSLVKRWHFTGEFIGFLLFVCLFFSFYQISSTKTACYLRERITILDLFFNTSFAVNVCSVLC